ncbi:hypothetical protein TSAR_003420 [Trichomalopsis sarcophagae]|uniref:Uncharacterized protein n=1 Tax=Trichomalopsis sarcophagae TaxID=543379 RepID=A0A232FHX4_9HYME|nr:hypothetical protein TSAR_003420 [Trichomalopsis sarcophagae]
MYYIFEFKGITLDVPIKIMFYGSTVVMVVSCNAKIVLATET